MTTVPDFPERPGGRWVSDDVYEFDTALEVGPGAQALRLDFSQIELPDGMTRDDLIQAFSDPSREMARPVPQHIAQIPIRCPTCGAPGVATLDLTKMMLDLHLDPFEDEDVKAAEVHISELIEKDGGRIKDDVECEDCARG